MFIWWIVSYLHVESFLEINIYLPNLHWKFKGIIRMAVYVCVMVCACLCVHLSRVSDHYLENNDLIHIKLGVCTYLVNPWHDIMLSSVGPHGSALWLARGGTPSLRVSRDAPRFWPPFSASGRSFCPPKIWPCLPFYSDLVGSHFETPHFQHVDDLFAPQIDQIYNFIQILLGPILNFEPRTPTDFYPECPPRGGLVGNIRCSHN